MKRLAVRLTIVAAVLAAGAVAVTQAQRMGKDAEVIADEHTAAGGVHKPAGESPKPIPVTSVDTLQDTASPTTDVPAQLRFSGASASETVADRTGRTVGFSGESPAAGKLNQSSGSFPEQPPAAVPAPDPYGLQAAGGRGDARPTAYFSGSFPRDAASAEVPSAQPKSEQASVDAAGAANPSDPLAAPATAGTGPANPPTAAAQPPQSFVPAAVEMAQASSSSDAGGSRANPMLAPLTAAGRAVRLQSPSPEQTGSRDINSRSDRSDVALPIAAARTGADAGEAAATQVSISDRLQATSPSLVGGESPPRADAQTALGAGSSIAQPLGGTAHGVGRPGDGKLEGLQAPAITLEKTAPAEIQVDKPATFHVVIRNVGQVAAHDVTVVDEVPEGTRFIDASPPCARSPEGGLSWQLGTLAPGEEKSIAIQLLPTAEGEIGSVAEVLFRSQASVRTVCTKPQLTAEHTAPEQVLIGEAITMSITVSNPGSGDATGVIIEEDVPEGLSHAAGKDLEYEVGVLPPGGARKLELELTADKAGVIENVLRVRGDGNLMVEDRIRITVLAPQLQVAMNGPSKRYLDRQVSYSVSVSNPGTAAAENVELIAYLPKGLKFVATDHEGQYDPAKHAVYWSLAELPPAKIGEVSVTALPVETGEQKLRVEGRANLGLSHTYEHVMQVDSAAELFFTVTDTADPIEVGSDTTYEIRVANNGSKTDTNIQLTVAFPGEMSPIGGDGATRGVVREQQVVFEPLARLAPNSEVLFRVSARGLRQGDSLVRAQLTSDELQTPVKVEQSTRIYADK